LKHPGSKNNKLGARTYLISDNFPELSTNLVATLTTLDVHDFTHFEEAVQG